MWWLIPVILATWEVELGRIMAETSLGKVLARPHLSKQAGHGGMCHSHMGGISRRMGSS
jgi:hypothetical protein